MRTFLFSFFCILLGGCKATGPTPEIRYPAHYAAKGAGSVVFVANGSGDSGVLVARLTKAAAQSEVPLQIKPVDWSYGKGRVLPDHLDKTNQQNEGRRLAYQVQEYLRSN